MSLNFVFDSLSCDQYDEELEDNDDTETMPGAFAAVAIGQYSQHGAAALGARNG